MRDTAKACEFCEVMVAAGAGSEQRHAAMQEGLEQLTPDEQQSLRRLATQCDTAEEFANQLLVGSCPRCESLNTSDLSEDPEVEDICVARCYDCSYHWCLECGKEVDRDNPGCGCIEENEDEYAYNENEEDEK